MKINRLYFLISFLLPICVYSQEIDDEYDDEGKEIDEISKPETLIENTDSLLSIFSDNSFLIVDTTSQSVKDTIYDASVYIERLSRIPSVIELPYNNIVQKYINQYIGRLRYSVSTMLGKSNLYIPIFEEALEYYGLPYELKYLPIIESALNPKACSRVGAKGLWQFMLKTGKQYGLEINSLLDERCDPIKSSYAAAKYLKDLYEIFGDWTLVIASYNCGPNNINKAIHRSGGEHDYWKLYPYLPSETRGYVPAFIAANYVMNYYGEHNISATSSQMPTITDTIKLSKDVSMEQIAAVCDIDLEDIKALNPQYTTTLIPGSKITSTLRLPQKQLLTFIDKQDSVYNYKADELLNTTRDIVEVNEERVYTPSNKSRRRSQSRSVTIKSGQTLSEIARRNGTTVAKLRRLNGIRGNNIQAGKKLRVR
ncbi:MAG: transglycosylase SLT domain-containing protein [Prevotellaceae bacterium]|nr:transglycosylase SLT domain-containing protein [Candidatus Faecinaster equi]